MLRTLQKSTENKSIEHVSIDDFKKQIELAKQGDAKAQCYVGYCYENGIHVRKSENMAAIYYKDAVKQKEAQAHLLLVALEEKAGWLKLSRFEEKAYEDGFKRIQKNDPTITRVHFDYIHPFKFSSIHQNTAITSIKFSGIINYIINHDNKGDKIGLLTELLSLLTKLPSLTYVDFTDCGIFGHGEETYIDNIPHSITNFLFGIKYWCMEKLVTELPKIRNLKTLILNNNYIGEYRGENGRTNSAPARLLFKVLPKLPCLTTLEFYSDGVGGYVRDYFNEKDLNLVEEIINRNRAAVKMPPCDKKLYTHFKIPRFRNEDIVAPKPSLATLKEDKALTIMKPKNEQVEIRVPGKFDTLVLPGFDELTNYTTSKQTQPLVQVESKRSSVAGGVDEVTMLKSEFPFLVQQLAPTTAIVTENKDVEIKVSATQAGIDPSQIDKLCALNAEKRKISSSEEKNPMSLPQVKLPIASSSSSKPPTKALTEVKQEKSLALLEAAKQGDNKLVEQLISEGADIEVMDSFGCRPLHYAAAMDKTKSPTNHTEVVNILIKRNADVGVVTHHGWTPLMCAVKSHPAAVTLLLNRYVALEAVATKSLNATALLIAVAHDAVESGKILLAGGANIHARNTNGLTVVHCVKSKAMASLLLEYKAALKAIDVNGNTGLHVIVQYVSKKSMEYPADLISFLIESGMDAFAKNKEGKTAATLARDLNQISLASFIEREANRLLSNATEEKTPLTEEDERVAGKAQAFPIVSAALPSLAELLQTSQKDPSSFFEMPVADASDDWSSDDKQDNLTTTPLNLKAVHQTMAKITEHDRLLPTLSERIGTLEAKTTSLDPKVLIELNGQGKAVAALLIKELNIQTEDNLHQEIIDRELDLIYYSTLSVLISGMYKACEGIFSGYGSNGKSYSSDYIAKICDQMASIPVIGMVASGISLAIQGKNLKDKRYEITTLAFFFVKTKIPEEFLRQLSRKLTLGRRDKFKELSVSSPHTFKEKIKNKVDIFCDWLTANGHSNPIAKQAYLDFVTIIGAILDGTITGNPQHETILNVVLGKEKTSQTMNDLKKYNPSKESTPPAMVEQKTIDLNQTNSLSIKASCPVGLFKEKPSDGLPSKPEDDKLKILETKLNEIQAHLSRPTPKIPESSTIAQRSDVDELRQKVVALQKQITELTAETSGSGNQGQLQVLAHRYPFAPSGQTTFLNEHQVHVRLRTVEAKAEVHGETQQNITDQLAALQAEIQRLKKQQARKSDVCLVM